MKNRRGFSLLEIMIASTISVTVLVAGYCVYAGFMHIDDVEERRESMTLTVQNVMHKIKTDVRSGSSVTGSSNALVISGGNNTITYRNLNDNSGLERVINNKRIRYKGLTGEFSTAGGGVNVTLRSKSNVHRRPIEIEINSFVHPRNR